MRPAHLAGAAVLAGASALYLSCLAPSITLWDSGEFVTSCYVLGIPHPPGAPLYILVGRLFCLLPWGEIAWRVNLLSALSSAAAVACASGIALHWGRAALGRGQPSDGDRLGLPVVAGAALSAAWLASSRTLWSNATEAEVYGPALLVAALAVWLVLRWEETGDERRLLAAAYVLGLGAGVHQLCLLTLPALGVVTGMRPLRDRRRLLALAALFVLGLTTYASVPLRSALDPAIDEADPESLPALLAYVTREQYGDGPGGDSGAFPWLLQARYLLQQFPLPVLELEVPSRRATGPAPDAVPVSAIPWVLAGAGAVWQARRHRRGFGAVAALFLASGPGLTLYLDMADPQPRERDYVYGLAFLAVALWIGLGATAALRWLESRPTARARTASRAGAAALLLLPLGTAAVQYRGQDRSHDHVARDLGENLLRSCEPGAVLFTGADNDTFPVWYAQFALGMRPDVRVANLTLMEAPWYLRQLRDRPPPLPVRGDDERLASLLESRRPWPAPREVEVAGLRLRLGPAPGSGFLAVRDLALLDIVEGNDWRRPLRFAITVPDEELAGLTPYLRLTGLTRLLTRERDPPADVDRVAADLGTAYRVRVDPEAVRHRPESLRIVHNYRSLAMEAAAGLQRQGRVDELSRLLAWASSAIPFAWQDHYTASTLWREAGRLDSAAAAHERAAHALLDGGGVPHPTPDPAPVDRYSRLLGLADEHFRAYGETEAAARLYRRATALAPARPEAHLRLAAVLRMAGDAGAALAVVEAYIERHGPEPRLVRAREALRGGPRPP